MSIISGISALIAGALLGNAFRKLKLTAPLGMSLLLPLCFILGIEIMLIMLIVMSFTASPARIEHPTEIKTLPSKKLVLIVGLSCIFIVFSLVAFQLIIDKAHFLALSLLCITAVVCFQAYIIPIPNDKPVKPRLLSLFLSMLSAITGLAIPTIGMDAGTGLQRYSIGITELYGGIDFVIIVLGLCCIGEILYSVPNQFAIDGDRTPSCAANQTAELFQSCRFCFRIADILLAVTLGIPFSVTSAIIVGTIALYGVQFPYSLEFLQNTTYFDFALILVYSFILIGVVPALFKRLLNSFTRKDVLARSMTNNMSLYANWRNKLLSPVAFYPILTVAAFVGAYSIHYRLFDIYLLIAFGFIGFLMRRLSFPITPLIVCAALGYRMEEAFRAPFSWTYLTVMFYLLSCIIAVVYIKIIIKSDSNDCGNASLNDVGDYKRQ